MPRALPLSLAMKRLMYLTISVYIAWACLAATCSIMAAAADPPHCWSSGPRVDCGAHTGCANLQVSGHH